MGYQNIEISGDIAECLTKELTWWYRGRVNDIEVYGVDEDDFAAVAFAAVEMNVEGQAVVEGVVCLLRHNRELGETQFLYKDIHENAGPYASFCPRRILDQLTPTDNDLALAWRDRCRRATELTDSNQTLVN